MSNAPEAPSATQWPDLSAWPDDDAPPIEWARFYRDRCGGIVVPTAGPMDVLGWARSLAQDAAAAYAEDHGAPPDEETAVAIWDAAREEAEQIAGRPIGYIYKAWMAKVAVASDVTDQMLAEAWEPLEHSRGPRCEADRRGVAILPNRSARGLPVVLVDVDPRHGGEVDGPWGMQLPGPKASTPGGGVHTLMLATGREVAGCDLGPGVDVVAAGGTAIPLPSGSATPGRRWLRRDPPVVAPEQLRKRGRKRAPPRVADGEAAPGRERQPGDDWGDDEGQAARVVSQPTGDGVRNRDAGVIVGMLARPRSCPQDFTRACLEMLAEDLERRGARSDEARAEMARWQHLLTRGPRDAAFAAEVMETWLAVRGDGRRMRRTPAQFCESVWRVCDRREDGRAGEEDRGVGPRLGWWPPDLPGRPEPPPPPAAVPADDRVAQQEAPGEAAPADPVPFPPPPPEVAQAAVEASRVEAPRWRGGIDPRTYVHPLGSIYTDQQLERDLARRPVRIDAVFPAVDFVTGHYSSAPDLLTPRVMHGWGVHLSQTLRGMSPGDFRIIGAGGAGVGKTGFVSWLTHGLAMQTAARILGISGYEDAPLIMPVWATEMPKDGEVYFRAASAHLGFDQACLADGQEAHDAPGVLAMAAQHGMAPGKLVEKARAMERLHGADPRFPFHVARYQVTKVLRPSDLPRRSRRAGVNVDHRAGPDLVDHLADAVDFYRSELATLAGVPEDQVLPLVMVDPAQRFAGDAESEKRAIDAFLQAVVDVLCREVKCAVIGTSDTTKGATRQHNVETFLSKPAGELASDVLAGTMSIQHHADCIALCSEPARALTPEDIAEMPPELRASARARALRVKVHARVLKNRNGGLPATSFPFEWDMHLGRYHPLDPEPLRPPPEREDDQRRGGGARPTNHGAPGAAPRLDRAADYRLHKAGARMRDGSTVEDLGLTFTNLAREAVQIDGRPDPHPGKRWWPDVVVSGRAAAHVLAVMTCRHERVT